MATSDDLLAADIAARDDALDVKRSFIVQAPAGSGKTELLIQRYLKLLAFVEDPEEIIAITFTRKAAAEMQFRVLEALRRANKGEQASEAHEILTLQLASAALSKSRDNGWNLIGNPRRMRMQTLDSLNASIARAQPLSTPSTANGSRVVVDADLKSVHRAAALATLDWLAEEGELQVATHAVLTHVDNNTGLYVDYVSQMLATRDQWLPFIGSGALAEGDAHVLREKFESALEFVVSDHVSRTKACIGEKNLAALRDLGAFAAKTLLDAGKTQNPICSLATDLDSDAAGTASLTFWHGLAELLLTQKGELRKRITVNQGFPADQKEHKQQIADVIADISEHSQLPTLLHETRILPPTRYSDPQWDILLALFRLLPLAVSELKRLFAARGISDHVDIAMAAGDALGSADNPGDVALLLDYQVRHLLVDEMQDTSSAQYRMLEALTGGWVDGDGRTMFCVGDPMQSVYRFRNAEVGQFLLAREFGIGHMQLQSLVLRRNFRSGERLVDWFNAVFPEVMARIDDPLRGAVSYSPSVPAPHLRDMGECVVHPVFAAAPDEEAAAGSELLERLLAKHPDDSIAVLVRGRTQLPALLSRLRLAGIPYRAVDIDRLTDLPEIIDVLALTRAAVHQGDRIAWLGVLRAPWIALEWADLHALVRNDSRKTVWELLNDGQRVAALSSSAQQTIKRVLPLLESLVAPRRILLLRDLVERCWFSLGGPAAQHDSYSIENVYRFFDVLGNLEHAGTLDDIADFEAALDLERVSSNTSARLQIMTMHRAKGLQFDHVVLFGLGRQPGSGDRRVLSWFDLPDQHGEERKIISPVGARSDDTNDAVHQFIEHTEKQKDRSEQARLLYVACTRARFSLHLIGHVAVSADGETFRDARSDSLLRLIWPAVEAQYAAAFATSDAATESDIDAPWAVPQRRGISAQWCLPPVQELPGRALTRASMEPSDAVEFYWVGTEARYAGTLIHRWFQLIAEGQVPLSSLDTATLQPVTLRWLQEQGITGDTATNICERVLQAISACIADDKGKWLLSANGESELALTGLHDGELVSVVLDRVLEDESGDRWIVDYKTSTHEGGDLEHFLSVEADRYRPQLARYASLYEAWSGNSVRCALYFPLLGEFRELQF